MKKTIKKKIDTETRSLFIILIMMLLAGTIVIILHAAKNKEKDTQRGYVDIPQSSYEDNLNREFLRMISMGETDLPTEVYRFEKNYIVDTAWAIPNGRARQTYEMLKSKRNVILTDKNINQHEQDTEKKLREIEEAMDLIKQNYKQFLGWKIRHTCYLNESKIDLYLDADTTGRYIEEVYAYIGEVEVSKDSLQLQEILRKKFRK